jgi:hypothetical protein
VRKALTLWYEILTDRITVTMAVIVIALLIVSGPFGTLSALTEVERTVYWSGAVVLALVVGVLLYGVSYSLLPKAHQWHRDLCCNLTFPIVFTFVLLIWDHAVEAMFGRIIVQHFFFHHMFYIYAITFGLWGLRAFGVRQLMQRAGQAVRAEAAPERPAPVVVFKTAVPKEPRLLQRLPKTERAPVVFLKSEGHFVDVYTGLGASRIRMRLRDAISEMEGVIGYCSHRSYWVTADAVVRAEKMGNSWRLHMSNGEVVPVSRKYQPGLEDAGLLRDMAAE